MVVMSTVSPTSFYKNDLAHIHDDGFGAYARNAAEELLQALTRQQIESGLVVELGCGSGIMAEVISSAGYRVLGFDISAEMIELARQRVPAGQFCHESFLSARWPSCAAVVAIGEVFNYAFDRRNSLSALQK